MRKIVKREREKKKVHWVERTLNYEVYKEPLQIKTHHAFKVKEKRGKSSKQRETRQRKEDIAGFISRVRGGSLIRRAEQRRNGKVIITNARLSP